jgi:hypothetical protein
MVENNTPPNVPAEVELAARIAKLGDTIMGFGASLINLTEATNELAGGFSRLREQISIIGKPAANDPTAEIDSRTLFDSSTIDPVGLSGLKAFDSVLREQLLKVGRRFGLTAEESLGTFRNQVDKIADKNDISRLDVLKFLDSRVGSGDAADIGSDASIDLDTQIRTLDAAGAAFIGGTGADPALVGDFVRGLQAEGRSIPEIVSILGTLGRQDAAGGALTANQVLRIETARISAGEELQNELLRDRAAVRQALAAGGRGGAAAEADLKILEARLLGERELAELEKKGLKFEEGADFGERVQELVRLAKDNPGLLERSLDRQIEIALGPLTDAQQRSAEAGRRSTLDRQLAARGNQDTLVAANEDQAQSTFRQRQIGREGAANFMFDSDFGLNLGPKFLDILKNSFFGDTSPQPAESRPQPDEFGRQRNTTAPEPKPTPFEASPGGLGSLPLADARPPDQSNFLEQQAALGNSTFGFGLGSLSNTLAEAVAREELRLSQREAATVALAALAERPAQEVRGMVTIRLKVDQEGRFELDGIGEARGPLGVRIEPDLGLSDFEDI